MATTDDDKKRARPYTLPDYGQAALAQQQSAPRRSLPAQKEAPQEPALPVGQRAGLAVRRAASAVNRVLTTPLPGTRGRVSPTIQGATQESQRQFARSVGNFTRGLSGDTSPPSRFAEVRGGSSPAVPASPASPRPPGARPTSPAPSGAAPSRGAAVTPSAGVGGPSAAGSGAPPPQRVLRTLDRSAQFPNGRTGSVASGVGDFGENVYDNESIARLQGGAGPSVAPTVARGSIPATATPAAPAPRELVPQEQELQYQPAVSRTLRGDLRGAEQERQQLATGLDRQIDRLARQADTRSERALLGELVGQRAGLTGKRVDQVTGLETSGAQLEAEAATRAQALTAEADQGRLRRRLGGAIEQARIESDEREGAADRAASSVANRQLVATEDGAFGVFDGTGELRPVTTADGSIARAPREGKELDPGDILSAYNEQLNAIRGGFLEPAEQQQQLAALDASPLGREYARVLGGKAVPEGMTRVGTTPDGRPVYRDAQGNTFTDE